MRYAFLCYDSEAVIGGWSKEHDAAVIAEHHAVEKPLVEAGRLKTSLRLMPTTTATTVRSSAEEPFVLDGPFAETKEQLLGFWLADCDTLDDAVDFARKLSSHKPTGCIEIRPVMQDYDIGKIA